MHICERCGARLKKIGADKAVCPNCSEKDMDEEKEDVGRTEERS